MVSANTEQIQLYPQTEHSDGVIKSNKENDEDTDNSSKVVDNSSNDGGDRFCLNKRTSSSLWAKRHFEPWVQ